MRKYSIEAECPLCHQLLNDPENCIRNAPALKFLVENKGRKGYLWLSAVYGDHSLIAPDELDILPGDVVKFFCPHCEKPLPVAEKCYCKAEQLKIRLVSGGDLQFCNRKGCYYCDIRFSNPDDLDSFLGLK